MEQVAFAVNMEMQNNDELAKGQAEHDRWSDLHVLKGRSQTDYTAAMSVRSYSQLGWNCYVRENEREGEPDMEGLAGSL